MKKLSVLFLFFFVLASCNKNAGTFDTENTQTKKRILSDAPPPLMNQPTEEELVALGFTVGCELAKALGGAGVTAPDSTSYGPYSVFYNTIHNETFPAIYKEAVQNGWQSCLNLGAYLPTSCDAQITVHNGSSTQNVNYWEFVGIPCTGGNANIR